MLVVMRNRGMTYQGMDTSWKFEGDEIVTCTSTEQTLQRIDVLGEYVLYIHMFISSKRQAKEIINLAKTRCCSY